MECPHQYSQFLTKVRIYYDLLHKMRSTDNDRKREASTGFLLDQTLVLILFEEVIVQDLERESVALLSKTKLLGTDDQALAPALQLAL